jgi:hypothetical protein
VEADWELVGHGWFQQSLKQADDEAAVIMQSLERLERCCHITAWTSQDFATSSALKLQRSPLAKSS